MRKYAEFNKKSINKFTNLEEESSRYGGGTYLSNLSLLKSNFALAPIQKKEKILVDKLITVMNEYMGIAIIDKLNKIPIPFNRIAFLLNIYMLNKFYKLFNIFAKMIN